MSLPTSYLTGGYTKIPQYFDALLTARAPEKFTNKFMADLGFTSSVDRLFANVLKSIGFLDEAGVPTDRYFKFLDQSFSKQMVAEGVREAYVDLFNLNMSANNMSQTEVEGKFKTLTNGSKAPETITKMAKTFLALCSYADWSATATRQGQHEEKPSSSPELHIPTEEKRERSAHDHVHSGSFDLNYNIHIHLPATRDQSVYDALFASLAKHIPLT